jgi:hypothetical protein
MCFVTMSGYRDTDREEIGESDESSAIQGKNLTNDASSSVPKMMYPWHGEVLAGDQEKLNVTYGGITLHSHNHDITNHSSLLTQNSFFHPWLLDTTTASLMLDGCRKSRRG